MRRVTLVVMMVLSLLSPSEAAADPILVIPVAQEPEHDSVLPMLETLLSDELEHEVAKPSPVDLKSRVLIEEPDFENAEWTELVDSGISAYIYTDSEQAIENLELALIPVFEETSVLAVNPSIVVRVMDGGLTLIRAYQNRGDPDSAKTSMTKLIHAFPGMEIDQQRYPPEVQELHKETVQEVMSSASVVTIEVLGKRDCTILVNGFSVGQSPREMALPEGRHYIQADCGALLSFVHVLDVSDQPVTVQLDPQIETQLSLSPQLSVKGTDQDEPQALAPYSGCLSRLTGTPLLLFVGFVDDGTRYLQLSLYDGDSETLTGAVRLEFGVVDEQQLRLALRALFGGEAGSGTLVFDGLQFQEQQPQDTESVAVWPWVTLGVGAALVIGASVVYALGESDHRTITDAEGYGSDAVDMDQSRAHDLEQSADDKKLVGYLLWGAGGAMLLGAAILFVIEGENSVEEDTSTVGFAPLSGGALFLLKGSF